MAGVGGTQRCVGDWLLGAHLGAGSFAVVWKAHHRTTGQVAAVKEINLARLNAKLRQSLESEVSILKRISHPNVVQLLEVLEAHGRLFLVMEFCAGGDLAQLLRAVGSLPEDAARRLMQQLAAGLREMWAHHLVHRDLKPQNLLLSAPGPVPCLKIADFGFARALGPQLLAETLCGSPLYMAPEILLSQRYDAKADLWSVGAILYEMLAGAPPYTGNNQVALLRNIKEREARLPADLASRLSELCRLLVHSLLRRNPVERISFEEFFTHPFLADRQQQQQQRQLGGSTSTGTAAHESRLPKSGSVGSMPHHVIGFAGGGGEAGAAARLPPPAAVPVGRLTEQLRSRGGSEEFVPGRGAGAPGQQVRRVSVRRLVQPLPGHQARVSQPPRTDPGGAAGPLGTLSAHSDASDDYVLVGSASQSGEEPSRERSREHGGLGAAAAAAAAFSPAAPAPVPPCAPSGHAGTAHKAAHEAFLLPSPACATEAAAGGASSSSAAAAAAAPLDGSVPWQGASRRQFLRLVAAMISALAADPLPALRQSASQQQQQQQQQQQRQGEGGKAAALASSLSFHLAALQLYDLAMGAPEAARDAAARPSDGDDSSDEGGGSGEGGGASGSFDSGALQAEALGALQQAEAVALALQAAAATGPNGAAALELPSPWEGCHQMALQWARDAAADELLGNYPRSERAYAQAGAMLHFLANEAPGLNLQPAAVLAQDDEARLQRCASAAAARWAACASLATAERGV